MIAALGLLAGIVAGVLLHFTVPLVQGFAALEDAVDDAVAARA